jgi:hypothetical protein
LIVTQAGVLRGELASLSKPNLGFNDQGGFLDGKRIDRPQEMLAGSKAAGGI